MKICGVFSFIRTFFTDNFKALTVNNTIREKSENIYHKFRKKLELLLIKLSLKFEGFYIWKQVPNGPYFIVIVIAKIRFIKYIDNILYVTKKRC